MPAQTRNPTRFPIRRESKSLSMEEEPSIRMPEAAPHTPGFKESRVESTSCPPRSPGPYPCRVPGSDTAFHSGENPGVSRRAALQFRNRRRDLPLGTRGAAPATGTLHRRRNARSLRAVGAWRAAAPHGPARGAGLRPCRRAVSPQRSLGSNLENQSARATLARSRVPHPARAGHVLLARVRERSRPEDPAQLLAPFRPARAGPRDLGHQLKELLGRGRGGRRDTPLSARNKEAGAQLAPARFHGTQG